jgi:hypothetical protein
VGTPSRLRHAPKISASLRGNKNAAGNKKFVEQRAVARFFAYSKATDPREKAKHQAVMDAFRLKARKKK